ncbi:hypothetical protein CSC32_6442 [Pseudomonas aeruginosa]|nr:hypothetical protein CSC32_6442 [Pseudomonas aeruginosa]
MRLKFSFQFLQLFSQNEILLSRARPSNGAAWRYGFTTTGVFTKF